MLLLPFTQKESTRDSSMYDLKLARDCEDPT